MPNKSLGQHWLKDRLILEAIADSIPIHKDDLVLEVGPGLGTLTSVLLGRAKKVVAVEYDESLASKLPGQFPGKSLQVVREDFLEFNLTELPSGYKVVANIPYYITQKIIEALVGSSNRPLEMALLVQKEVAEKLSAKAGKMTLPSVKSQMLYDVHLGTRVPKEYFTPPPKVDSQVVVFKNKHVHKYVASNYDWLMRVVKAGFSSPRKKLSANLAGGLMLDKKLAVNVLESLGLSPDSRAQELSVDNWINLARDLA